MQGTEAEAVEHVEVRADGDKGRHKMNVVESSDVVEDRPRLLVRGLRDGHERLTVIERQTALHDQHRQNLKH